MGDLVSMTGRVRLASHKAEGTNRDSVDMFFDDFTVLVRANGNHTCQ